MRFAFSNSAPKSEDLKNSKDIIFDLLHKEIFVRGVNFGLRNFTNYETKGKDYAVTLTNGLLHVSVPWTDNDTWRPIKVGDTLLTNDTLSLLPGNNINLSLNDNIVKVLLPDIINGVRNGGNWLHGANSAAIIYNGLNKAGDNSWESFLTIKTLSGNSVSYGSIYDTVGFSLYKANRTENGVDARVYMDTNNGNVKFTNSIIGASFIKSEGKSSEFLKADGSVDSNTYLTTGNALANYVSALGTSGNYITWTKNGTANNLTVPYSSRTNKLLNNPETSASAEGGLTWFNIIGTAGSVVNVNDTPTSAWWYVLRNRHTSTSNNYYTDLAIPFNNNGMYYKVVLNNAVLYGGWVRLFDKFNLRYLDNGKNYALRISDSGLLYVSIPWTDNDTWRPIKVGDLLLTNDLLSIQPGNNINLSLNDNVLKINLNPQITLQSSTSASVNYSSKDLNPNITFKNSDGSQCAALIYSEYDSYQAPDSLTLIGNQAGTYFIAPNIKATGAIYGTLSKTLTFASGAFSAKTYNNSSDLTINIPTNTTHLTNGAGFITDSAINNHYWANIKISSTSNTNTTPTFGSTTVKDLFVNTSDATLKIYSAKVTDAKSDGSIALQTCIDGTNGLTHSYAVDCLSRNNLILQPRGGQVYVGKDPGDNTQTAYKLTVGGNAEIDGRLAISNKVQMVYNDTDKCLNINFL